MSSSKRSELMATGVGASPERVRRMLPSLLTKSRRIWGVRFGPRPFDLGGKRMRWSYARSPCLKRASLSFLGDSKERENPRAARSYVSTLEALVL